MERILTYAIGADAAGLSILEFLKKKQFSRNVVTQLKKTENGILVDGNWAYVSHILREQEMLTLNLIEAGENTALVLPSENARHMQPGKNARLIGSDENAGHVQPACLPVIVAYEDEDLLVVDKPAHMPIHPSMGHYGDTLADAVICHAAKRQESYPYRCINRLDRDTSGLTVIAKNAYSSCILYGQMQERKFSRTYYAIAKGLTEKTGTIDAPIARAKDTAIKRTVDFASGERAVTHYETLAHKDGLSFLKLRLETGRTHQIRVHMHYIGHPLIGDFLYNPSDSRMERQALHAGILAFTHPVSGQALRFAAPLPEDMLQFFPVVIS